MALTSRTSKLSEERAGRVVGEGDETLRPALDLATPRASSPPLTRPFWVLDAAGPCRVFGVLEDEAVLPAEADHPEREADPFGDRNPLMELLARAGAIDHVPHDLYLFGVATTPSRMASSASSASSASIALRSAASLVHGTSPGS